jgi:hypothetical protein
VYDESIDLIKSEDKRLNFPQFKRSLILLVLMVFKVQKKKRNQAKRDRAASKATDEVKVNNDA